MDLTQCGRIGCVRPAVGVLLIAAQEQRAWLVGLGHDEASEGVPLCHEHADRISVPFGWQIDDARTPVAPRRRRRRAGARTALPFEPELELGMSPAEAEQEITVAEAVPTLAVLPSPEAVPEPAAQAPTAEAPVEVHVAEVHAVEVTEVTTIEVTEVTTVEVEVTEVTRVTEVVAPESPAAESPAPESSPAQRELSATERTPLLQRAFRIAGD